MTRHLEVLKVFRRLELEGHAPVSLAAVGDFIGLSRTEVHRHCQKLVGFGLMVREEFGENMHHYRTVEACPTCGKQ